MNTIHTCTHMYTWTQVIYIYTQMYMYMLHVPTYMHSSQTHVYSSYLMHTIRTYTHIYTCTQVIYTYTDTVKNKSLKSPFYWLVQLHGIAWISIYFVNYHRGYCGYMYVCYYDIMYTKFWKNKLNYVFAGLQSIFMARYNYM